MPSRENRPPCMRPCAPDLKIGRWAREIMLAGQKGADRVSTNWVGRWGLRCSDERRGDRVSLRLQRGTSLYLVGVRHGLLLRSQHVKRLGSQLSAPFMALSFMPLLVIPDLILSDRDLFSGKDFHFAPLRL
jgi:Adenine deaminase C-terminal domain